MAEQMAVLSFCHNQRSIIVETNLLCFSTLLGGDIEEILGKRRERDREKEKRDREKELKKKEMKIYVICTMVQVGT